jgi:ribosome-binding protein aMBF1 (putative translation factor)
LTPSRGTGANSTARSDLEPRRPRSSALSPQVSHRNIGQRNIISGMPSERRGTPKRSSSRPLPLASRPGVRSSAESWNRYERARTSIMIGSTVRAARRRAGVTQAELAALCATSQPAIARLEKGLVAPTVVSLDRIARALGAELVIDFEPLNPPSEGDRRR